MSIRPAPPELPTLEGGHCQTHTVIETLTAYHNLGSITISLQHWARCLQGRAERRCRETLDVIIRPGPRSRSIAKRGRMHALRRSLIAAPMDGNVPSSEEKSILRERISSRAIQLYMAMQLCSPTALRGTHQATATRPVLELNERPVGAVWG